MARYPAASWTPLPENFTQAKLAPTQIILHSAVSRARSLFGYFSKPGVNLESHFYVDVDGSVEQLMDTNVRADANFKANARAISIETYDNGDPDKHPWTGVQLAALERLVGWAAATHRIPLRWCRAWDSPGVGYHSLFKEWSPVAKTCCGLARRGQVAGIIAGAADAHARSVSTDPEDDMTPEQAGQLSHLLRLATDTHNWMTAMKNAAYPGRDGDVQIAAPLLTRDVHEWIAREGRQLTAGLATLVQHGAMLDPEALAAAVAAAVPDDLAAQVVDALALRLARPRPGASA